MTAQGSAHSRLRRALDHGASALVVRALALEAGRLELHDALAVCLVLLEGEPEDTTVAAAVLDRLLHHCTVVSIEGESYRMRGHRERLGQLREAVAGGGEFR